MDLAGIELRTERLLLRRCREDDLDRLAEIQSLPVVARLLSPLPPPRHAPRGPLPRVRALHGLLGDELVFAVLDTEWRKPTP
jgi:hypothetical protein